MRRGGRQKFGPEKRPRSESPYRRPRRGDSRWPVFQAGTGGKLYAGVGLVDQGFEDLHDHLVSSIRAKDIGPVPEHPIFGHEALEVG